MLYLASDHAGFELKEKVAQFLRKEKIEFEDLGTNSKDSVDYPVYAKKMAQNMIEKDDRGILICGSGIGMSIAINRFSHIRGALCYDTTAVELSRKHNNSNVLILAGRRRKTNLFYKRMINAFFKTEFEKGRHLKRVEQLSN